jgi:hypothetical protein
MTFHSGELAVQEQAGVSEQAGRIGQSVRGAMPPAAQDFLRQQRLAILGGADAGERVWASLLAGEPGFLEPAGEAELRIHALPIDGDPLAGRVEAGGDAGLVAIDLASRRRLRVNGVIARAPGGAALRAREVFFNCPKYIQAREQRDLDLAGWGAPAVRRGDPTEGQRAWIAGADTFFLASVHRERGADASHRGGPPGFVRVIGERGLLVPDYAGNNMFQTLGNLALDPRVGLLFLDFERGRTLQATGTARLIWDPARFADLPGAQRALEIEIAETVEVERATPRRWRLVEPSPHNPTR